MDEGAGGLGVAGDAGVVAGVVPGGPSDEEGARLGGQVRGDVDTPVQVVVDHPVVVVPEDVDRRVRALPQRAQQQQRRADPQELVRLPVDLGSRLCNTRPNLIIIKITKRT